MIDFEHTLQQSLSGINDKFNEANNDLRTTVLSVAKAVEKLSHNSCELQLRTDKNDTVGVTYSLIAIIPTNERRPKIQRIDSFIVQTSGYPIVQGEYQKFNDDFEVELELKDKAELTDHFLKLLSNPESALLQAVAFAIRNSEGVPF